MRFFYFKNMKTIKKKIKNGNFCSKKCPFLSARHSALGYDGNCLKKKEKLEYSQFFIAIC